MDISCEEIAALGLTIANILLLAAVLVTYYNQCTSIKLINLMCSRVVSLIFCSMVIALAGIYVWLTYCLEW